MNIETFRNQTAVVGIGYSRSPEQAAGAVFTKASGVSPLTLALRAAREAASDAGIDPWEIDGGIMRHVGDSASPGEVLNALGAADVAMALEIVPGPSYSVHDLALASEAVHSGRCKYVLVYRALNGSSGTRMGRQGSHVSPRVPGPAQFTAIFGWGSAPQAFGIMARRYMEVYGVSSSDLGTVSVNSRRNAQANPRAYMHGRPMTIEDHQASRWVAEPYHLLDCCLESDGAAACIVTTTERARELRKPPVLIVGSSGSSGRGDDVLDTPIKRYVDRLYAAAGISRDDLDLAEFYDNFSDQPMRMIEDLGFCKRGEAKDFMKSERIDLDGRLPIQTAGGLMSEGYSFHMNNLVEAVQQLRGEAEDLCPGWRDGDHTFDRGRCRQVRKHDIALHTMAIGTSAVVLRRDN